MAANLLTHYSFDLNGYNANELINSWQSEYPINWLHLAVIEALYQGRYKAVSVQHILISWLRREKAVYHFNMEFERLICSKFPQRLTPSLPVLPPAKTDNSIEKTINSQPLLTPVGNNYRASDTIHKQESRSSSVTAGVLASPSFELSKEATKHQPIKNTVAKVKFQENSPIPAPPPKILPETTNHRPIDKFIPQKSDRSELFTSKLKAMTAEQPEFAL
ncbi:hypothetical protein VB711_09345 [Cronbergia sp. UHCC 0137]|uniref:hypothetical protein n=1 Tax=Cronbergia sp. UHCC 0137 TaxID=3110239 RepID=UPI002B21EA18|nr:hypothetical protein [Cronbergia sp. UHCC 0137]MEA5618039.1 hypothetical protein [Cronbergia sp. UHCC 0137]